MEGEPGGREDATSGAKEVERGGEGELSDYLYRYNESCYNVVGLPSTRFVLFLNLFMSKNPAKKKSLQDDPKIVD